MIQQAYKIYLPNGDHTKLLDERGLSYVTDDKANGFPSHEKYFFDLHAKAITERAAMPCVAQSTTIKCGTSGVITGIPTGAKVVVLAAGSVLISIDKLDGDEFEFETEQIPVTYTVILSLFPWADTTISIEAV